MDQTGDPPLRVPSEDPGTVSATGNFLNASHRTWPHSAPPPAAGFLPRSD